MEVRFCHGPVRVGARRIGRFQQVWRNEKQLEQ